MKPHCFVGIDTSNYTTSAAIADMEGKIVANLKAPLPVREGECGLRQSDAVFAHVRNLPEIMERLKEAIRPYTVAGVGVSVKPRDAEDSYMPCFLAGRAAAESFAAATDLPIREFSHQSGHIMAAVYSSGASETLLSGRFGAFHVSGGTTEMLSVTPREDGFSVRLVGGSADLNAGQAIDRAGVMMGLRFPCGKEMEALAATWQGGKLPRPRVTVREGCCNLSGLQNLAEKYWRETRDKAFLSAFVFDFIGRNLSAMTRYFDEKDPGLPIVYAGGVMSNRGLQQLLSERKDTYFAEPQFSADNAAGIALLCRRQLLREANGC